MTTATDSTDTSAARWTPKRWEKRVNGVFFRVVHGEHKITVADGIVSEADANLIVVAPELLASLRHLRAFWMPGSDHDTQEVQHALAAADAALAKATGGAA